MLVWVGLSGGSLLEAGWSGGSLCIGGVVVGLRLGTESDVHKVPGLDIENGPWLAAVETER